MDENNNFNEEETNNIIVELDNMKEDTLFDEDENNGFYSELNENNLESNQNYNEFNLENNQVDNTPTREELHNKKKEKKEFFWKKLSKKQKIIIIVVTILIILLIAGLLIYFLVIKKPKKESKKENIVIAKDNYIYENGSLKFLDDKDNVIGKYKCVDENVNKCYVPKLSNEDTFDIPKYLDEKGKIIEKNSSIYSKNYVFVFDEGKISLYDISKKEKTGDYKLIKSGNIDQDLVVVKDNNDKYGLISFVSGSADTKLEFKYEYLGIINSVDKFVAKIDGSYYLVDINGSNITSPISASIKNFDDKYISVEGYKLYDYTGKEALPGSFSFIDFNSSYVFTINNGKMLAYDKDLNALNKNGIQLKNTDYVNKYILDDKNNLVETKKSYEIKVNSNEISIEVFDGRTSETKTINLYESEVNKNLKYIDYLEGSLYFYSDEAKENLIGSYKCTNKNSITSGTSTLDNCYVAKDTNIINNVQDLGYTPIFNGNYAFISDTPNGSDAKTIILYDLSGNAAKAKYSEIDTGLSASEITFVSMTNGLIYAKNTEGNYGIITFSENGPSSVIPFRDKDNGDIGTSKLELYGDNYIIAVRNGTNYLYDKIGNLLIKTDFDIKDYTEYNNKKYVVVENGKKYLVYEFNKDQYDSGKIISNEFDYIKLYDDIYVGIKDKKLNVYDYSSKTGKIKDDVKIYYTKSLDKSYELQYPGNIITIYDANGEVSENLLYDKNWVLHINDDKKENKKENN